MITAVLQTDGFYFSCTYDLTHTVQRLSRTSPDFLQMPLYERVNRWINFMSNLHLLQSSPVIIKIAAFLYQSRTSIETDSTLSWLTPVSVPLLVNSVRFVLVSVHTVEGRGHLNISRKYAWVQKIYTVYNLWYENNIISWNRLIQDLYGTIIF